MIEKELRLPESERMNFLAITTPNDLHFSQALKAVRVCFLESMLCSGWISRDVREAAVHHRRGSYSTPAGGTQQGCHLCSGARLYGLPHGSSGR